jgi:hypothetical protein
MNPSWRGAPADDGAGQDPSDVKAAAGWPLEIVKLGYGQGFEILPKRWVVGTHLRLA